MKNGFVKWGALVPVLLALAVACMGATVYLVDSADKRLYDNIEQIKKDIRVIQEDVKTLLQEGSDS